MVACALEGASEARTEHFDRPSGTDAPLCIISQHFVLGYFHWSLRDGFLHPLVQICEPDSEPYVEAHETGISFPGPRRIGVTGHGCFNSTSRSPIPLFWQSPNALRNYRHQLQPGAEIRSHL